jgi:large subunit ribosomal protein L6
MLRQRKTKLAENYYFRFGDMSKIGQKTIEVPSSVQAEIQKNSIAVKGKLGEITIELPLMLTITKEGQIISVKRNNESKTARSLHGLFRNLVYNAVFGVENGWKKNLEVVGTGYNVKLQGEDLVFKVGYSHPVVFKKVPGLTYQVEGNNKVTVTGADKQLVGQIAHQIKLIKKPDVYKGKGVRYEGERLRIKPGKKAKAA